MRFAITSADTGASLSRPVGVLSGAMSEPASSTDVDARVGGATITTRSVALLFEGSAKSHVWNGAVKGHSARTISEMAQSLAATIVSLKMLHGRA